MTGVDQAGDPIGAVDALVAGVDPGLSSPEVESRDVVLVTGPWLAGATGLIAALRDRLPEHEFVEAEERRPRATRPLRWCSWSPPLHRLLNPTAP